MSIYQMSYANKNFDKRTEFSNLETNIRFINAAGAINRKTKIMEIGSGNGSLLNYFYKSGHDIRGLEIK
ncbi:MAG: hypothetical protein QNJ63_01045 [Calothrix sp. MO_192.B10]|nr:hypothetical protein [Calothrix sp. MO_192.B10]